MTELHDLELAIHATAVAKGWWDEPRSIAEILSNIHAEVSEAWECYRDGEMRTSLKDGKPEGFGVEMADIVIRVVDACQGLGIDLTEALEWKMQYNETRPYPHGGKRA